MKGCSDSKLRASAKIPYFGSIRPAEFSAIMRRKRTAVLSFKGMSLCRGRHQGHREPPGPETRRTGDGPPGVVESLAFRVDG